MPFIRTCLGRGKKTRYLLRSFDRLIRIESCKKMMDDAIIVFFRFNFQFSVLCSYIDMIKYLRKISSARWFYPVRKRRRKSNFLFDTLEATSFKFTIRLLPPYNQYSVLWCTVCRWGLHSLPNPHPHQEREEKRVCAPMRKIRGWYRSNDFLSLSIAFHHFFFFFVM